MIPFLVPLAFAHLLGPSSPENASRPDSTVVRDSIYSLAVKPSDFPKDAVVWLLDEGIYRIEPDGKWSRTLRQVVQILKPEGALGYREQAIAYEPDHERTTVNWMRVVTPDGHVVSARPAQSQESDVPAEIRVPMYTATKVKRMSLAGLDSGTILDFSITTEEFKPDMPGNFYHGWTVNPSIPVRRSVLVVDVPTGFKPRITEKNLDFKRTETVAGGRTLYRWTTDKVSRIKFEPFAPDSSLRPMTVAISPAFEWSAVGDWYAPIADSAYHVTPEISKKVTSLVAGAKTLNDSLRAIHHWVAHDIRYVAITLGRGGYVPRDPDTVMRTGFGDCKDKTMLFLSALKSIGIAAYPVILNAGIKVDESVPTIQQFNHMIAAVPTGTGYQFTDLTAEDTPYGKLPSSEDGHFGLVVRASGTQQIHLPDSTSTEQFDDVRITGSITTDGMFSGVFEERSRGGRSGFEEMITSEHFDSAAKSSLARAIVRNFFDGAEGDSLTVTKIADSPGSYLLRVRIGSAHVTSEAANLKLLANPIHPPTTSERIASQLEKEPLRTLPIDLSKITPRLTSHYQADIQLPAGWRAFLPKSTSYTGLLGLLEFTYAQQGTHLLISRKMSGAKGVLGAERIGDVISALKERARENTRTIAIETNPN